MTHFSLLKTYVQIMVLLVTFILVKVHGSAGMPASDLAVSCFPD